MTDTGRPATVSVIIPTLCSSARAVELRRAIASVLAQEDVVARPIVVINGNRRDPALEESLHADPRLLIVDQAEGNLPAALRNGRMHVTSEFFSFLDDDDEYLPGALKARVAAFRADGDLDVVATNGFRGPGSTPYVQDTRTVNRDPLVAMIASNWLASCGGLFRSSAIHADYFDGATKYFEWTLLAFRVLFAGHKVRFIDTPTFRVNDSPGSLSKSPEYHRALADFLEYVLSLDPPRHVRRALKCKLSSAWHSLSDQFRDSGDRANAWRCHLRSLVGPKGLRYLPYTRRLIM